MRLRPAIAVAAVVGGAIAVYLTYVHYSHTAPICTTGGCEKVQKSKYAELGGVPVALLGLFAYCVDARDHGCARLRGGVRRRPDRVRRRAFSGYLLWAQLGPIGAICQWCVGNDVVDLGRRGALRRADADRAAARSMSRRGALLFAAMCVIWGIPYLLIRVAVRELAPVTLVFGRTAIGALLLTPIAAYRGELRPLLRCWAPLLAYTAVEVAIPWVLLARAETKLTSSLTGLLIAAVPLVGALIVTLTGDARAARRRSWLGLLIGIAGVAAIVGLDIGQVNVLALVEVALRCGRLRDRADHLLPQARRCAGARRRRRFAR